MAGHPLRICLILHSTRSDNLGVGALTVSEVSLLRELATELGRRVDITVMDWRDARPPYVTGDDIEVCDLDTKTILNPFGYARIARRSDLVIDIGAGDSFTDIYGTGRLRRMMALKFITHLTGTPLVTAPQTIGPFTRPVSRMLARLSLRWSALVATRDEMSTHAAMQLGARPPLIEASDLALCLPYDSPAPRRTAGPVRVGLNVSGLLMGGGYTGENQFGLMLDYPALMRELITYFQTHSDGCEVHLVPHVIVPEGRMQGEDDYRASQALAAEFPRVIMAPPFESPSEAKSYIAGLDFFLGARMHACIAAFSSGVPVVPMAYSRKFSGLFGTIGYDWTVDCTAQNGSDVLAHVKTAYEARDQVERDRVAALDRGLEKISAYREALKTLILGIS